MLDLNRFTIYGDIKEISITQEINKPIYIDIVTNLGWYRHDLITLLDITLLIHKNNIIKEG